MTNQTTFTAEILAAIMVAAEKMASAIAHDDMDTLVEVADNLDILTTDWASMVHRVVDSIREEQSESNVISFPNR